MSDAKGQLFARLSTNRGEIVLRLFSDEAPETVENFVGLAEGTKEWVDPRTGQPTKAKLYDGTVFHRVIKGFMLQGGDPLGNGRGGPGYRFKDEPHPSLKFNRPYLLAMANAGPNTNGSQFFITVGATDWLNGKHTIFGEVVEGRNVIDTIAEVATDQMDKPLEPVVVESVSIERK
ncbi:peptidylprolyl isomerase [Actinorugispora endophytica]|uniref:Peptidyl-prolyl cis-trans isomerase n=1 Tax=Actinorugispora endophytica TaxID=1605990 RepID=A0A4R6V7P6_9ACTN|nr:peptidylprolyl isomerase [Actinorugispora endophytica]TDQ52323.1 peptidyl-prolyl cis-trans isomerase A (cyclophilin A) [Actinorugispora endophytica]